MANQLIRVLINTMLKQLLLFVMYDISADAYQLEYAWCKNAARLLLELLTRMYVYVDRKIDTARD